MNPHAFLFNRTSIRTSRAKLVKLVAEKDAKISTLNATIRGLKGCRKRDKNKRVDYEMKFTEHEAELKHDRDRQEDAAIIPRKSMYCIFPRISSSC